MSIIYPSNFISIGHPSIQSYDIKVQLFCANDEIGGIPLELSWMVRFLPACACICQYCHFRQYNPWEKGVAYPGVEQISIVLRPGIIYYNINYTFKNSCRAIIPREGSYEANFTQTTTLSHGYFRRSFTQSYNVSV